MSHDIVCDEVVAIVTFAVQLLIILYCLHVIHTAVGNVMVARAETMTIWCDDVNDVFVETTTVHVVNHHENEAVQALSIKAFVDHQTCNNNKFFAHVQIDVSVGFMSKDVYHADQLWLIVGFMLNTVHSQEECPSVVVISKKAVHINVHETKLNIAGVDVDHIWI